MAGVVFPIATSHLATPKELSPRTEVGSWSQKWEGGQPRNGREGVAVVLGAHGFQGQENEAVVWLEENKTSVWRHHEEVEIYSTGLLTVSAHGRKASLRGTALHPKGWEQARPGDELTPGGSRVNSASKDNLAFQNPEVYTRC